tara:strand:- start:415 stop:1215 length:801 start_codon:yes stop_codon:yes gene_type:complete
VIKEFFQIKCVTEHPHPVGSPDYLNPAGVIQDNNTHQYFIYELDTFFQGMPYRLIDIGCAGGQFAVDVWHKGAPFLGVGIEGGHVLGEMSEEFEERSPGTRALTKATGAKNWARYKDKCLFHADVSKPFEIRDVQEGSLVLFNAVTAFEFFEHPLPEEIPGIIENIKKHLIPKGCVWGTINLGEGEHHRCAKSVEWWDDIFAQHGFTAHAYPFQSSPRTNHGFTIELLHHRMSENAHERLIDQSVAALDARGSLNVYPIFYVLDDG